jgi:hypothetical protein
VVSSFLSSCSGRGAGPLQPHVVARDGDALLPLPRPHHRYWFEWVAIDVVVLATVFFFVLFGWLFICIFVCLYLFVWLFA